MIDTSFKICMLSTDGPEIITVNIYKDENNKRYFLCNEFRKVPLTKFHVAHLKDFICNIKKVGYEYILELKLWKLNNVKNKDIKDQDISTEEDIVRKLHGEEMKHKPVKTYFLDKLNRADSPDSQDDQDYDSVDIITIIPTTGLDDLDDRKRKRSIKGFRTFASYRTSRIVYENTNYYIEPKEIIENLGNYLYDGKFCLLYGSRQSGKTTIAYSLQKWLVNKVNEEVYFIDFSRGIVFNEGLEKFWKSVCRKLISLDKDRFLFDEHEETSSSTFKGLFSKRKYPNAEKSILIVDEASYICEDNVNEIFQSFITSLQDIKRRHDQFSLHSVLLIGTEHIKKFLISHNDNADSPFTAEESLSSTRFTQVEIQELLNQYASDINLTLDEYEISMDIYSLTHGHKGLVGLCCSYIDSEMMQGRYELTCDDWNKERNDLLGYLHKHKYFLPSDQHLPLPEDYF